jgi:hypothetical protein
MFQQLSFRMRLFVQDPAVARLRVLFERVDESLTR